MNVEPSYSAQERLKRLVSAANLPWELRNKDDPPLIWANTAINDLIRKYKDDQTPVKEITIDGPFNTAIATTQREIDHFIEIQFALHAAQAVDGKSGIHHKHGEGLAGYPLAEFLRLAQFLNHEYNMYSIPKAQNNYKSRIAIALYANDAVQRAQADSESSELKTQQAEFIEQYLAAPVPDEKGTVKDRVIQLLEGMAEVQGEHSTLCREVGKVFLAYFTCPEPRLKEFMAIGAFIEPGFNKGDHLPENQS